MQGRVVHTLRASLFVHVRARQLGRNKYITEVLNTDPWGLLMGWEQGMRRKVIKYRVFLSKAAFEEHWATVVLLDSANK